MTSSPGLRFMYISVPYTSPDGPSESASVAPFAGRPSRAATSTVHRVPDRGWYDTRLRSSGAPSHSATSSPNASLGTSTT